MPSFGYFNGYLLIWKAIKANWRVFFSGGKESTVQRQATLPVWRNDECNKRYFQDISANFICAGYSEGGKDACQVSVSLRKQTLLVHYIPQLTEQETSLHESTNITQETYYIKRTFKVFDLFCSQNIQISPLDRIRFSQ